MAETTANQLRQAITKIEDKAAKDVKKLKERLSLVDSPFNVGDKLQSTLWTECSFLVVGSCADGLTGVRSDSNEVIAPDEYKHWRVAKK